MNSVDDSAAVTPADTSNLSSPDSTSSEFSQPTVKLRVNKETNKRQTQHDQGRIFTADGHDPFIQTLDKDGRHLVETTGRTAQRTRASIRDSSRYNQKCHQRDQGERAKSNEYPWPHYYHQPRKSHSSTNASSLERNANRRVRKRHSYGAETTRKSWDRSEFKETPKRYSAGDYLRQQILEDLNSNEIVGKTDQQIAEDRCNRIKAYLRRRNDDLPYVTPETRLREIRDWSKFGGKDSNSLAKAKRRKDLDRIRTYLQDKIRAKMNQEEWRNSEMKRWSAECANELSIQDIKTRYSDYDRAYDRDNYPTRKVRSDVNIRRRQVSSSDSELDHGKVATSLRGNGEDDGKKGNICRRTKSDVVPEMIIDYDDNEVKTRFYSYLGTRRNSWKTKSGLTFEKKLSLPNKMSKYLDRGSDASTSDSKRNDWQCDENCDVRDDYSRRNNDFKKYCRRTRSDTVKSKLMESTTIPRKSKKRSVSWSDRRKLQRKTSARSAGLLDSTSVDSEVDSTTPRRGKSQQKNSPSSWREYKEKRRQDQLRKELANAGDAGNLKKTCSTTEAWTSYQENCPSQDKTLDIDNSQKIQELKYPEETELDPFANYYKTGDATKTNDNMIELTRNCENANDTETETILQENYLLLERDENQCDGSYQSATISRLQVNEYRDEADLVPYEANMMDFGYSTIVKNSKGLPWDKCWPIEFNSKSNVKKSDTFKIVDGSENNGDYQGEEEIGIANYGGNQSFWPSNDSGSSSVGRTLINNSDDVARVDETIAMNQHSEGDDASSSGAGDAVALSNKDIATDYFRRVYELLKQRQEDDRRETLEVLAPTRCDSDSSSNNYDELEELRKRRRRRKKDKGYQGEELVAVSPGVGGDDGWGVQRILVNNDPENLIFRRPQLQNVTGHKRPRHPAPPIPANCKINAKDISKYFDYPNKENSPRNGVDQNGRSKRNELIEHQQQHQQVDSNETAMGSNLSRHNGKGLTGRRTQSSGNLCDPKGKLNHVGKILVPCSSTQRERYKICSSLPNHLDDKEILDDDDPRENNNTISDNMGGNFGGTLPHKKRSLGVHFSDASPTGTLDLVKHRSQDSLEGDPWRYQEGVDLDLVRCKHGNFDVVRKNQSVDVVDGDASGKTYGTLGRSSDGKCFRGADLDLVGTLPKRRAGEPRASGLRQSFEARQNRPLDRMDSSDLLIKVMHKPDCELMKHHQFDRVVDLKLSRLAGGEPQDQGYASERSPEDEHPPSLPGQPFPKVTPENTFRVILQKSSRGLGLSVSGGGTAGPVRVKRLFPQQPAALSKKLQSGDILLAANGVPLTGLTNYEALEVLRTTPSTVELVVCRVPGDTSVTSPGAPPPPPARREPPSSLRILNPQPPLQIEPCGEFDIEMTKVAGSLGFTLRKVDSSALGHYVRALVREPALSDGRIQPGDKIVSVDGAPLSPMSHEEAVALLRQCGPRVKLRLYRDLAQTPVSALSPTEPDHPLRPPRTSLRQEAVDMLCDLAVRKLSPDTSNGANSRQTSAASCHSPRRLRKPLSRTPTADNDPENHLTFHPVHPATTSHTDASDTDQCSINTQATNSQSETPANDIIDPPPLYDVCDSSDSSKNLSRPSFLDLTSRPEKPHFRFSLESESDYTGPIVVTESDSNLTAECEYDDDLGKDLPALSSDEPDNNLPSEPASMPPLLSTTRTTSAAFSYKNPAYQSANPTCGGIDNSAKNKIAHSSDHDIPGKVLGAEDPAGSKGLLKWKGVMFAPNDEVDKTNGKPETEETEKESTTEVSTRNAVSDDGNEVFTVELTRGWNSRLGFSLQPEGNSTVISVVHPDSVAAKDGRLMEGDVLIMVNDESVENMPTAEIIDLLRKIRGSIGITVIRKSKRKNVS